MRTIGGTLRCIAGDCLADKLPDLAALHRVQPVATASRVHGAHPGLGADLTVQRPLRPHRGDERTQPLRIRHGATQALAFDDVGVLGSDHAAAASEVRPWPAEPAATLTLDLRTFSQISAASTGKPR